MNYLKAFVFFLAVVGILSSCKTARQATKQKSRTNDHQAIRELNETIKEDFDSLQLALKDSINKADSIRAANKLLAKQKNDTISIIGVGDIMLGTSFPKTHYLPPNRGKDLLSDVAPILKDADVTFGNLEGVILNGEGHPKRCNNPDACYLFKMPEYLAQNLLDAGIDVVSIANNHAGDFGNPGRKSTMRVLDSLGIYNAGLLMRPYTTFTIDGVKYGFVAFAPNNGTVSIHDRAYAEEITLYLNSICDIVITSFHGGAEGKDHQHVTRTTEQYYGENRGNVYEFAHLLIEAGADVVFGHGPHVTRSIEVYNKKIIAYSLGNFCTYARFNLSGPNGIAPILKVYLDEQGNFLHGAITPVKQIGSGVPKIDESNEVIKKLQFLMNSDFPESTIFIDDNGNIKYIQSEI